MTGAFDSIALAASIKKMLATANLTVDKPGASIVTQRLIDYSSGEFGKLDPEQLIEVLAAMDKKYESHLLKDGNGNVIGYVYSPRIFVSLKDNQQKPPPWQQEPAPASRGRSRRGRRGRPSSRSSNPQKSAGETMSQQEAGKKSQGGAGQEDYAAKYAAQYMGAQDDAKGNKKKKPSKKKDDAAGDQEDYAAKYAAQYGGQQGGDDKSKDKKKKKKDDKKKDDKKSDKKKTEKKSDKKKKK